MSSSCRRQPGLTPGGPARLAASNDKNLSRLCRQEGVPTPTQGCKGSKILMEYKT